MNKFELNEKIVCLHSDFNWHGGTDKKGKAIGPKEGEIVTFLGHLPDNFGFIVIKEYLKNEDGQVTGWNVNKFGPLNEEQKAEQAVKELLNGI